MDADNGFLRLNQVVFPEERQLVRHVLAARNFGFIQFEEDLACTLYVRNLSWTVEEACREAKRMLLVIAHQQEVRR